MNPVLLMKGEPMDCPLMNLEEVCDLLCLTKQAVGRAIKNGILPKPFLETSDDKLFRKVDIEECIGVKVTT